MNTPYTLAYSSCPNDTFIFKGIARKRIHTRSMDFSIVLEDVETLNQRAAQTTYDVTKLSFAALGNLLDRYALLRTGSALGLGCGPLVISLPDRPLDRVRQPVVAVPGLGTTAYYLFRFFMADRYPGLEPVFRPMAFETIMPSVLSGQADLGVIIHEGRFVFQDLNLEMKTDLGQWWEKATGLPIPLGCIAVRRDMTQSTARTVQELIAESIDHARAHPDMDRDYIREYAQEMAPDVIRRHIDLYVNAFSRDIGDQGLEAVTTFFDFGIRAGLMAPSRLPLLAC